MSTQSLADGRYLLGSVVGTGGMAEVYRARDTRLGRDVAVKLFRSGAADGVSRGSDEARLLAGLHHPGLVRVLDMDSAGTSSGPTYLVMELVEGPDLGAMLTDGPLPEEAVRLAGWDVARTLAYIHQQGILHRDIKPSNILTRSTDPDSGVFGYLLTDFGIARFHDAARQTATGQTIGTAAYLSPEQARGGSIGTSTDIYSLGLVLLEALTGDRAYPGTSLESAVARLHRAPSIPSRLGSDWHSLLSRMTADSPGDRPTAGAVAAEFAQWKSPEPHTAGPNRVDPHSVDPHSVESNTVQSNTVDSHAVDPHTRVLAVEPSAARFQLSLPDEPLHQPAPTTVPATAQPITEAQPAMTAGQAGRSAAPAADRGSVKVNPAGSGSGRRPARRRPWLAAVLGVVAVLVLGAAAAVGLNLGGPAPVEELPGVPGTTGELLNELYERVQP